MEFKDFLRTSLKIQGLFKTVRTLDQEIRGGELSLFACQGVGNRPPRQEKFADPQEYAGGEAVGAWQEVKLNHAVIIRERRKGVAVKQITQVSR